MPFMHPKPQPLTSPTREDLTTFMPLVHKEVARMMRRVPPNVLRDDLVAAGSCGLLDALRRSSDHGPAFEWYARVRIRGALVDELRSEDWLSRRARARATKARADGSAGGRAVVGFDDLPEVQQEFADKTSPTPLELVERRGDRTELDRAVAQLPKREASIVAWHYFDEVSFKTIAGRLGVSEPRISQLHSRAIDWLKTGLVEKRNAEAVA
jgi:RNA polymerase sigma factor for flagellar operon FliA